MLKTRHNSVPAFDSIAQLHDDHTIIRKVAQLHDYFYKYLRTLSLTFKSIHSIKINIEVLYYD